MNTRLIVSVLVFLAIVFEPVVPASGGAPGLAENAALQYWKAFAGVPELSHAQMDAVAKALEQGTIAPSLRQVIASSKSALHELRKGAAVKQCAWGISFDEGINAVLPHLSKARQLARVACLRAEVSFQQGKAQEATEDVAAVMTLGRHIAADSVLISLLVDYAIEGKAIKTTAAHLPSLDVDQLKDLSQKLDALPPQPTVAQAVLAEKEMYVGWIIRVLSKPDGKQRLIALFNFSGSDAAKIRKLSREELIASAKQLQEFYDRLAKAVTLPPDQTIQAEERLMANPGIEGPAREMALGLVPAIGAARRVEATHQTQLALLKAAVAVRLHGPDVLQKDAYRDPFGTGTLKYTKIKNGFKLQSTLTDRKDQPVELTVGRP